jgi:excisionase family DNA binding protein
MILRLEDLPGAVSELLEKVTCIEQLLKSNGERPNETEGLLTISGASVFLNLSKNTIYKLAQHRAVPYIKKGKRLYFLKEELLTWLKAGRKQTEAELKLEAETGIINAKKNRGAKK